MPEDATTTTETGIPPAYGDTAPEAEGSGMNLTVAVLFGAIVTLVVVQNLWLRRRSSQEEDDEEA